MVQRHLTVEDASRREFSTTSFPRELRASRDIHVRISPRARLVVFLLVTRAIVNFFLRGGKLDRREKRREKKKIPYLVVIPKIGKKEKKASSIEERRAKGTEKKKKEGRKGGRKSRWDAEIPSGEIGRAIVRPASRIRFEWEEDGERCARWMKGDGRCMAGVGLANDDEAKKVERKEQRDGQTNGRVTQIGSAQPIQLGERGLASCARVDHRARLLHNVPSSTFASSITNLHFSNVRSNVRFDGWSDPFVSFRTCRDVKVIQGTVSRANFLLPRNKHLPTFEADRKVNTRWIHWMFRMYTYIYILPQFNDPLHEIALFLLYCSILLHYLPVSLRNCKRQHDSSSLLLSFPRNPISSRQAFVN